MSKTDNPLNELSDAMVAAVEKAGAATVLVDARKRFPPAASPLPRPDPDCRSRRRARRRYPGHPARRYAAGSQTCRTRPGSDLAVLRLDRSVASPAEAAPTGSARRAAHPGAGRPSTEGIQASLGVVSAIGGPVRTGHGGLLERYLRTDATPYPGFSGGPLVDTAGRVVGLNTSGLGRGAAITIPTALAWQIAFTLAKHGHVRRGFIGVRSQPVSIAQAQQKALGREQASGLLLVGVEDNSPAEKGGCW